jgi:hypothetical protein
VPPPPINVYVKYESMGDTREIDYKTALAAPQSEAESL